MNFKYILILLVLLTGCSEPSLETKIKKDMQCYLVRTKEFGMHLCKDYTVRGYGVQMQECYDLYVDWTRRYKIDTMILSGNAIVENTPCFNPMEQIE